MKQKSKINLFNRLTLFQKYLIFGLSIVLVSFIALGISMYIFVTNYYGDQQKVILTDNAQEIANLASDDDNASYYSDSNPPLIFLNRDLIETSLATISKSIDADIFIVDNKGKTIICSDLNDNECIHKKKNVPQRILAETTQDNYFEQGDLKGYYDEQYYTAGVPVIYDDLGTNRTVGFCYVSTKATFVNGLIMTFMKIFIIATLCTLVIVFFIVLFMSYTMVRPLKMMSKAAKQFAVGDFSTRVSIYNRKDEIGQLAKAFNDMADSLSASELMRRSFISNVSHELKTPMTTIAGFIDGILDGTIPKNEHNQYLHIVSNEVKRLSRLVTSMLSLSRIDNGELKINKQNFDMFSMLLTILATFEQKIVEKEFKIEGLEDFRSITVYADPDLIYQVIYNLIENAVKFTNNEGYIRFSNEVTKFDITISIENSGPGIPPEDIKYIFDRFYKTDKSRSIDKKGMGLGLFISKTIMRMHNGDIFVESTPNEFTRFTFRLPNQVEQKKFNKKTSDKKEKKNPVKEETNNG